MDSVARRSQNSSLDGCDPLEDKEEPLLMMGITMANSDKKSKTAVLRRWAQIKIIKLLCQVKLEGLIESQSADMSHPRANSRKKL